MKLKNMRFSVFVKSTVKGFKQGVKVCIGSLLFLMADL